MTTQFDTNRPLRVCYFGTYRAEYTRNQILLKGLRAAGVEVLECHVKLWHGIEDRVQVASGGWANFRFFWRVIQAYWRLFWQHTRIPTYDVMLVGYPGQFDAYLGRILTWWRRKPLALDILMSLYLVAEERGLTSRSPFTGRLLFYLEKGGLHLPDLLIAENGAYEKYYIDQFSLPRDRFQRIPHGADEAVYHPLETPPTPPSEPAGRKPFRVTYHGGFLPSHGIDAIIGAAEVLRHEEEIAFHFYGSGPEKERVEALAAGLGLPNTFFHGFVSQEALLAAIGQADICCGVFGETKQSHFTVQNKLYEGLAMGRTVVSGESAVVRELLVDGREIVLVKRMDGQALAEALLDLKNHPEKSAAIGRQGHTAYLAGHTTMAIGVQLRRILEKLSRDS